MRGKMAGQIDHNQRDAHAIQMEEIPVNQNQNLTPNLDLLSGSEYFEICVPLRKAALEGDWKKAVSILRANRDRPMLRMAITQGRLTILHVAAGAKQTTFVEKIINLMKPDDERVLLRDKNGNNAFCYAAAAGDVKLAELMLKRNRNLNLETIRGGQEKTPLYMAVMFGRKDMATFLYGVTVQSLNSDEREALFFKSISTGLYDIALKLLSSHRELAMARNEYEIEDESDNENENENPPTEAGDMNENENNNLLAEANEVNEDEDEDLNGELALHMLARQPNSMTADAIKLVECIWIIINNLRPYEKVVYLISHPTKLLFDAAKLGNFKFIAAVVRSYPDLIHELDDGLSIFHVAITHRHANIFSLIYEMGMDKDVLATYADSQENNMLHLAAKYPDPPPASIVPGAALELQQEILMFEAVESILQPSLRDKKNDIDTCTNQSHTPKELFTMTHKDLKERGEKWMKSTAKSCMLVATLIATVVFSAAFSVPGGNEQQTGRPTHLGKTIFKVFVTSDAIAFSSSSISILIFLSILTSRYAEEDFRMSLPLKLMFGLLTLFISVIAMTIAFSSAFFLFYPYRDRLNWITVSTAVLVFVPVTVYVGLQYSLLKDTIYSTFFSRNHFKPKYLPV